MHEKRLKKVHDPLAILPVLRLINQIESYKFPDMLIQGRLPFVRVTQIGDGIPMMD